MTEQSLDISFEELMDLASKDRSGYIEAVRQRIEQVKQGSISIGELYNNFSFKFGRERYWLTQARMLDKPIRDFHPDGAWGHSELYLNQTPREFYASLDGVVKKLGYSSDVRKLNKDPRNGEYLEKFYDEIAPKAFLKLIEMGYNEADLIT